MSGGKGELIPWLNEFFIFFQASFCFLFLFFYKNDGYLIISVLLIYSLIKFIEGFEAIFVID